MPITNGYTTLEAFKRYKGITSDNTTDDAEIESMITRASRMIDQFCNRVFYDAAGMRYFTAHGYNDVLFIDDLLSITTLKTDDGGDRTYSTTWAATDYDLEPYNSTPKTMISITPNGDYSFPLVRKGVQIAGVWGYCLSSAVPEDVEHACLTIIREMYAFRFTLEATQGNLVAPGSQDKPNTPRRLRMPQIAVELLTPYKRLALVR